MKLKYLISTILFIATLNAAAQQVEGIDWQVDTIKFKIKKFIITQDIDTQQIKLDTLIKHIEISHPNFRKYRFPIYLGHTVSPTISAFFPEQKIQAPFYPIYYYQNCIFTPFNLAFFNTNIPYSYLYYTGTDKTTDEQILDFLLTMNSGKHLNYGIQYKMQTTRNQKVNSNSVVNAFRIWMRYANRKYLFLANLYFDKIKIYEDGGFIDTAKTFDALTAQYFMKTATNTLRSKGLTIFQKLLISPSLSIISYTRLIHSDKIFYEPYTDTNYFEITRLSQNKTYDSTALNLLENDAYLSMNIKRISLKFGIKNQVESYYSFKNYIIGLSSDKYYNNAAEAKIYFSTSKYQISANGKYFLTGRKKNNYLITSSQTINLGKIQLTSQQMQSLTAPSLFLIRYNGNHDFWNNNFKPIQTTNLNISISIPNFAINTGIGGGWKKNFIYFDSIATPTQTLQKIPYYYFFWDKKLHIKPFITEMHITLQNIENKNITLPHLLIFNSTYADFFMFKKHLRLNIGINTYYTDSYKALAYRPSTGIFYYENKRLTGSYPIIDIFAAGKVQRAQFFLKVKYMNFLLFKEYFFYVNHYHLAEFLILFGVKWWFKN